MTCMTIRFAVLGDGAWGTALALVLAQNPDHRVALWSAREESGRLLRERRENVRLLPGVPIPESFELTTDIGTALHGAELIVVAIPTIYLRETLRRIAASFAGDRAVVSLTKGLENHTFLRPSEVIAEVLGAKRVAVLSGPSHAEEVSRREPTTDVAAGSDYD